MGTMHTCNSGLLVFITILLCCVCQSQSCESNTWDYFTFRQQWPPTFCMQLPPAPPIQTRKMDFQRTLFIRLDKLRHSGLNSKIPCVTVPSTTWTVHGLWPTLDGNIHCPVACNSSDQFDLDKIQSIVQQLRKYWPNLTTRTPYDEFWAHEWKEHGTCAASLPSLRSQLQYFTAGLQLNRKFDVFQQLQDKGIKPSSTPYQVNDVMQALQEYGNPKVGCYYHGGKKYLYNIEICMDKSFQLQDCDSVLRYNRPNDLFASEECDSNAESVYYPQNTHG